MFSPTFGDQEIVSYCLGGPKTGISFDMEIANETGTDLVASYTSNDWYFVDNDGKRYGVGSSSDIDPSIDGPMVLSCSWGAIHSTKLGKNVKVHQKMGVKAELKEFSSTRWLHLIIPELSRVKNAAWEINVPR